jgi:hypothetical protein
VALQSWDEHRENHDELMRLLDREREASPFLQMRRWRRRFWCLLALAGMLALWFVLTLANR